LSLAARTGWGEWLGMQAWSHFVTLTFRYVTSPESAAREFLHWIRWLEQRARLRVGYFYAIELTATASGLERPLGPRTAHLHAVELKAVGHHHLHALVQGTERLGDSALQVAWRSGHSRVARFDPRRGAADYVVKEVGTTVVAYDVSKLLMPASERW